MLKAPIDIVLPSNKADVMLNHLLLPIYAENLKAFGAICLCAQMDDADIDRIKERCDEVGLELRVAKRPRYDEPSMTYLRRTAWDLSDAPYTLHVDDNIEFLPGAAEFFTQSTVAKQDGCGLVLHGAVFGAGRYKDEIRAFNGRLPATANGMLWLADFPPWSDEQTKLKANTEEWLLCANANSNGLWVGKRFYTPTRHRNLGNYISRDNHSYIHDLNICEKNCLRVTAELMGVDHYKKVRWNRGLDIPEKYTKKLPPVPRQPSKRLGKVTISGVDYPSLPKALQAQGYTTTPDTFTPPDISTPQMTRMRKELIELGETYFDKIHIYRRK